MVEGQGWSGANMVFWNSGTDAKMVVEKPPTAQNWAIGVSGPVVTRPPEPLGYVESVGKPVEPTHLYDAQLQERLAGQRALVDVSRQVQLVKHPFPQDLNHSGALVTIANVSTADILGPVQVVVVGLPRGVTVADATGRTVAGEPFLTLPVNDLGPGKSMTLSLRFTGPVPAQLTYNLVVYSGALRPTLPPQDPPTAAPTTPAGGMLPPAPLVPLSLVPADGGRTGRGPRPRRGRHGRHASGAAGRFLLAGWAPGRLSAVQTQNGH